MPAANACPRLGRSRSSIGGGGKQEAPRRVTAYATAPFTCPSHQHPRPADRGSAARDRLSAAAHARGDAGGRAGWAADHRRRLRRRRGRRLPDARGASSRGAHGLPLLCALVGSLHRRGQPFAPAPCLRARAGCAGRAPGGEPAGGCGAAAGPRDLRAPRAAGAPPRGRSRGGRSEGRDPRAAPASEDALGGGAPARESPREPVGPAAPIRPSLLSAPRS